MGLLVPSGRTASGCRAYAPELHTPLADMYIADERSTAHDERRAAGLAQDVHDVVEPAAGR